MNKNKVVLITGASSGLGEGMARHFARKGFDLALCARRLDRLDELKTQIESTQSGCKVSIKTLDVNEHDQVFEVFREFDQEFSGIDIFVINAGLGKGRPIGKGGFAANKQTAETNFIGALAQCEAAVEILRRQNSGQLAVISSVSAARGMPGNVTTYAATKAGVAALAEGIRSDLLDTPIKVTTIFPGYMESEMTQRVEGKSNPFMVDGEKGSGMIVNSIIKGATNAYLPVWPWVPLNAAMRTLPLKFVKKLM